MNTKNIIINDVISKGKYYNHMKSEYDTDSLIRYNMNDGDYYYYVTVDDQMFHFLYKNDCIVISLKDLNLKPFYDKLSKTRVDDDGYLLEQFEHFSVGTNIETIRFWMEWFFYYDYLDTM